MGIECEPEDAEEIDLHVGAGLSHRVLDERRCDGAVLRADREADSLRRSFGGVHAGADGLDMRAGVGLDHIEHEPFGSATVLDTCSAKVLENRLLERRGVGIGCR